MPLSRVLLVLGHGRSESLCHHLASVARAEIESVGAEVRVHDLLADDFDPVLRLGPEQAHAKPISADEDALVARYQDDVRWAEVYLIIYPVWWFAPPALLKGWVDRVFADEVALDQSCSPPRGLLGGKRALVVSTFKASRAIDRLLMFRIAARFWTMAVFFSVGIRKVTPLPLYEVGDLSPQRLRRFESKLARSVARLLS